MSKLANKAINPALGYPGQPNPFNNGPVLDRRPGEYQQFFPNTFTKGVAPAYRGDSNGNLHTPLDTRNINPNLGYNSTPPKYNP